jgi:hypothetical protein
MTGKSSICWKGFSQRAANPTLPSGSIFKRRSPLNGRAVWRPARRGLQSVGFPAMPSRPISTLTRRGRSSTKRPRRNSAWISPSRVTEIFPYGIRCCHRCAASRQQAIHIKGGQTLDALLQKLSAPAGKIGPPDTLAENHISGEKRPAVGPIKAEGARRVTRRRDNLDRRIADSAIPFREKEIWFQMLGQKVRGVNKGPCRYMQTTSF